MTETQPIGVFDSGIGGLTVIHALRERLPAEDILYFGDAARVPYGGKSAETVIRFTRECLGFLVRREVKLLVVACNTASALALPVLAGSLPMPAIGVIEPGVNAAMGRSRNRRIGVIGTEGTVGSGAYRKALEQEVEPMPGASAARAPAPGALSVFEQACPLFVPLAEEGWTEGDVPRLVAQRYLAPLLARDIDTLILGCTHYPLLRGVIAEVAGPSVALVDSGAETARVTQARLEALGLARRGPARGRCTVFVTDRPQRFREIGAAFLGEPLESVAIVDQSDLPWYER
jgi:glutamate racemase